MIQRYIWGNDFNEVKVYNIVPGGDAFWCKSESVFELEAKYANLEAKYAKLDKHCLALFYAVCDLICQDMTKEERADALQDANEAKSRFADDPDFWHIVDLDDNDGGDV